MFYLTPPKKIDHKRIYGKGYFDGLNARKGEQVGKWNERAKEVAALLEHGCTRKEIAEILGCTIATVTNRFKRAIDRGYYALNAAQYENKIKSLTGIAKKVFDALPKDDPVPARDVFMVLARDGGVNANVALIEGCLNTLKGNGLVKEPTRGNYKKAPIKLSRKIHPLPTINSEEPVMPIRSTDNETKAEISINKQLASRLEKISEELAVIAIELEDVCVMDKADAERFAQLKSLLKDL